MVLTGCAPCPARLCVDAFRATVVFDRLSPNIPELGLLLVPVADAAVVALLPVAAAAPMAGRAVDVGAPGLGSRLGDACREDSVAEAAVDGGSAALSLGSKGFFVSSFLLNLLRPAVGCRRERVRFSPVADDEDDMVSEMEVSPARSRITTCRWCLI